MLELLTLFFPPMQLLFISTIIVDEIEYGTGSATTRQGARDEAARKALQLLREEMGQ
jgi:dsRNA-specific ribonuclease